MKISAFTLIRNEAHWVGFHLLSFKDFINDFCFYDGNSTDGTIEVIEYVAKKYGLNVKLFRDKDPKDLKDDYVRLFNECMSWCDGDYLAFLHPDMIATALPCLDQLKTRPMAYSVEMDSFGGEPGKWPVRITEGRTDKWKNIMRNGFGLHYHGHYGTSHEDMYFSDITGKEHFVHKDWLRYPYEIVPSGIRVNHYSDVRPYGRRIDRMVKCLMNDNPQLSRDRAYELAKQHPRVSLEPRQDEQFGKFAFEPAEGVPSVFMRHAAELAAVVGKTADEFCPIALQRRSLTHA